ncbi:MAG: hypothetical protein RSN88_06665 [Gordonibacter sp.]|uniref:hypothetical protein n=1 Tax=Gordonibacter sp. TaxID=1968902 RepID=UPI002FCA4708
MKPIPSPNPRKFPIDGAKILKGREMAYMSHRWMERSEQAFFAIYHFVKQMQRDETGGRVRDRVAVFCIEHQIVVGMDEFTFGNAYWAGISRYLVLYDESLRDAPIRFNDSYIDYYGLLPVSYLPGIGREQ